jgi:hypothetical protein
MPLCNERKLWTKDLCFPERKKKSGPIKRSRMVSDFSPATLKARGNGAMP